MLSAETQANLDNFWAREIGCAADDLRARRAMVIALPAKDGSHYARVFRRRACRVLTCSPNLLAELKRANRHVASAADDEAFLRSALGSRVVEVFGRVYLGYAEAPLPVRPESRARLLGTDDLSKLNSLRESVAPREWEHGGLDSSQPLAGCFLGRELIAAAGYEVWGGWIAHICVVTASHHRRRGYGRDAVSTIANHAIGSGMVAQYQTLGSNSASLAVAAALGFDRYGEYTYAVVGQPN